MTEELLKRLDVLAMKLGVTANHLWLILVQQARVEAWTDLIRMVLAAGIVVLSAFGLRLLWKEDKHEEAFGAMCFVACVGLVAFCVAVTYSLSAVSEFVNPEYFAFQEILKHIGR